MIADRLFSVLKNEEKSSAIAEGLLYALMVITVLEVGFRSVEGGDEEGIYFSTI